MKVMFQLATALAGITVVCGLAGCSAQKEVPMLEGLDLKTAQTRVQECGFQLGQLQKEFTGRKDSGTVLRQVPSAAQRAPKGTTILLTLEESVIVPNLAGLDLESATRTLTLQQLRLQRTEKRFVGGDILGAVVSQEPATGTRVAPESTVDLVVDDFVVVPNFTGESYETVRQTVSQAGLSLGKKSLRKAANQTEGIILNQQPEAGAKVPRDTSIQFELASVQAGTHKGSSTGFVPASTPTSEDIGGAVGDAAGDAVSGAVKKGLGDLLNNWLGGKKKPKEKSPPSDDLKPLTLGPSVPTPLAPANGTVFNHFPRNTTLKWSPVARATSYTVEVEFSSSGWRAYKLVPKLKTTSFSFAFVGAQPGRWRVWAVDSNGRASGRSDWWDFRYTK